MARVREREALLLLLLLMFGVVVWAYLFVYSLYYYCSIEAANECQKGAGFSFPRSLFSQFKCALFRTLYFLFLCLFVSPFFSSTPPSSFSFFVSVHSPTSLHSSLIPFTHTHTHLHYKTTTSFSLLHTHTHHSFSFVAITTRKLTL